MQALACEGEGSSAEARMLAMEVAVAVAMAVVQADAFCESSGGPGTLSCALSSGTVDAVASATVWHPSSTVCCGPSWSRYVSVKKADRTSRQTQAGIGHSARAHRSGHICTANCYVSPTRRLVMIFPPLCGNGVMKSLLCFVLPCCA